jgi:uncharacterized protein
MRLSEFEIKAIKEVLNGMDDMCEIYLFGSRTDDNKRGGDIDILAFSQKLTQVNAGLIVEKICDIIGEQKVDLIIEKGTEKPFTRLALKEGIRL